jgi:glycosyltransferase involved in cell wall biosynthesis
MEFISKIMSEIVKCAENGEINLASQKLSLLLSNARDKNNFDTLEKFSRILNKRFGIKPAISNENIQLFNSINGNINFENGDTIYIVTPSFNSVKTIEQTIKSVVYQEGNFQIRYHVQDGGSTDGTIELLDSFKQFICGSFILSKKITFTYSSEHDDGMYDAISKGFRKILPEDDIWMAWINSDDTFMPGAFQFLIDVTEAYGDMIKWITGMQAVKLENGKISMHDIKYPPEVISKGLCDGKNWWFIQQEGTFWKNSLWKKVNLDKHFRSFSFAGDWNLWYQFSNFGAVLYQARIPLGLFHVRQGQLSQSSLDKYYSEISSVKNEDDREGSMKEIKDEYLRVFFIETFKNFGGIIFSSSLIKVIGKKTCFPATCPVKLFNG